MSVLLLLQHRQTTSVTGSSYRGHNDSAKSEVIMNNDVELLAA